MSITIAPEADAAPSVNMANGNAAELLELLGLTFDGDWGATTGADFHARVLTARGLIGLTCDAAGRPDVVDGRWTHVGRRPGYLEERLRQLEELAEWAMCRDVNVTWS